ncbi:MAG: hypothetical protein ABGZ35_07040 [Planctomycetaceae bacterium]
MKQLIPLFFLLAVALQTTTAPAADNATSLTDTSRRYHVPKAHSVRMSRGDVSIIVVGNAAIDIPELPKHNAGYNGLASLTHAQQPQNLFVPRIAGLNFEHIHDGTTKGLIEKFEPRRFPMELRVVDEFTVDLYQAPTGNFLLESCGRYRLLDDGVIEYTFECIPRGDRFRNNYIGLFWASYIHQPEDKSIFFYGRQAGTTQQPQLVNGITPKHGVNSTHRPTGTVNLPPVDADFPLTLVNHPSGYEYTEPWYYGVSQGMAFIQIFRTKDRIWLAQSPSGGGSGNPAWDFQWFVPDPVVGQRYGFVMRAAYMPFENADQIRTAIRRLRID